MNTTNVRFLPSGLNMFVFAIFHISVYYFVYLLFNKCLSLYKNRRTQRFRICLGNLKLNGSIITKQKLNSLG